MKGDKFKYEADLSYLDTIEVLTDATSFLNDNFSKEISFYCVFPIHYYFTDTRFEVFDKKWPLKGMDSSPKPGLVMSIKPGLILPQDPLSVGYQEIKRFSKGFSEVKIYQIKSMIEGER